MNKSRISYFVDLLMGVFFIIAFVTGLLKWTLIIRALGLSSMLLPMAFISELHDWSGFLMGAMILLHLVLHGKWIICMTKGLFRKGKECRD